MEETTNTLGISSFEDAPEALSIAEKLASNVAGALAPRTVGNATIVTLPDGYTIQDISAIVESAQEHQNRPKGVVHLGDVPSLLTYCADQNAGSCGYLYADPDARTITAVFNDQRLPGMPGWRDHRAHFAALYTPEFGNWLKHNKVQMTQGDFAEFIEDNFVDLQGTDAQTLLNVATTIQASTGISFSSARRLQDGQTQLTYNENIDAKAGADGALKIPQTFTLGLRIFKNGEGYKLTARLKYRMAGGSVKFWYELERPERAVEDAFTGYVEQVRTASGYVVLIGKA